MISLLDQRGIRHAIDVEAWVSDCYEWVVLETRGDCTGRAERRVETVKPTPVYSLGSYHTHYVASRGMETAEVAEFGPSDEHITCLRCAAGPLA